jgi:ribose 5-phosphate isomerase A
MDPKHRAGAWAAARIEPGMRVGLGTGSTAAWFVRELGARVAAEGLAVTAVATSEATARLAREVGLTVSEPDAVSTLDVTVDGADELDDTLRLIKGGGGALLREKIVAAASSRMWVVADRSKLVPKLGAFPLPMEVTRFGLSWTLARVRAALQASHVGDEVGLRVQGKSEDAFVTDGGNYILDCRCGAIPEPEALAERLAAIPGVVEHGLFVGLATAAVIADANGVRVLGKV